MTLLEYVNAIVWPGLLGPCLNIIATMGTGAEPRLDITLRLDRRHPHHEPRIVTFSIHSESSLEGAATEIHEVAMAMLERELYGSARIMKRGMLYPEAQIWDCSDAPRRRWLEPK